MNIKYKQFVILPIKPKMSKGKLCSQVAHSTFMALENQKASHKILGVDTRKATADLIDNWKKEGMCVIVLQCKSPLEMMGLAKYLEQWGIPNHLYIDEGITEVDMGTPTSLATGVMTEEQFWMLGTMDLFGTTPWKKFKRWLLG